MSHSLLTVNPTLPVKGVRELVEFVACIKGQIEKFGKIVKATGMRAE